MAERRMFAKSITNSARFLRMDASARLLYYDLGMMADDDGIVEAFTVVRTTGAKENDLHTLADCGFIAILDDNLVTYIIDWKTHNYIRSDRYKPSLYANLLKSFLNTGIPKVDQRDTQDRLGQCRLEKDSLDKSFNKGIRRDNGCSQESTPAHDAYCDEFYEALRHRTEGHHDI